MTAPVVLAVTSLIAATVTGALGYGYSSISVPIGLLVIAGRVLNPALIVVEVTINLYALWWNRRAVGRVWSRVAPLLLGLVPGVIAGALLLDRIAASTTTIVALSGLLPLILFQASGLRWPIRNERRASLPFGAGVGVLYGVTTISGPPLALFWNNQGLVKNDFRVGLALVRSIESVCALVAYASLGLLTRDSASLVPWIVPGVLIGVPIGHRVIERVSVESFRRVCMSFDAYLVSFALSRTLANLDVAGILAYQVLAATAIIDTWLLWRFFRGANTVVASLGAPQAFHAPQPKRGA
jgi:uncharacterized membrane protein YfcA